MKITDDEWWEAVDDGPETAAKVFGEDRVVDLTDGGYVQGDDLPDHLRADDGD